MFLAAQIFSEEMVQVIDQAQQLAEFNGLPFASFENTKDYLLNVDSLFDIMNGTSMSKTGKPKKGVRFIEGFEGNAQLKELLRVLKWFTAWKKERDDNVAGEKAKFAADKVDSFTSQWDFIPNQSFEDLNCIVQGTTFLISYLAEHNDKFKWSLRTISSDCVEHFFADLRGSMNGNLDSLGCKRGAGKAATIKLKASGNAVFKKLVTNKGNSSYAGLAN